MVGFLTCISSGILTALWIWSTICGFYCFCGWFKEKTVAFDKRLLQNISFKDYVRKGWNSTNMRWNFLIIIDRILECRKSMAQCRMHLKLNSTKKTEELHIGLELAMTSSATLRSRIPLIQKELAVAFGEEETYWKQKIRNTWLTEGDRNTRFSKLVPKPDIPKTKFIRLKMGLGMYKEDTTLI